MRNKMGRFAVLLVFALTTLLLAAQGQDEKMKPEAYYGVAVGTGGGMGARSIQFDLRITRYTTDEELNNFAALVKEKGTDALRRALEKENVGRLNPTGHVGNDIAVARKRQVGDMTVITIVTARIMSFAELYTGNRSEDYPFGYMQIKLNKEGKSEGMGQIMAAAKIKFNKKSGQYEIESYGNQYIKATNVHIWK